MLHGKVLTTHFIESTVPWIIAQYTYDGYMRRFPRHLHSELRTSSNKNLRHKRSKAYKKMRCPSPL